mmetsp:Transcript_56246/g.120632  ORF Transcript_56246/g.120632 Transcript_56246/m.120632 type:complete len:215 (-) Transcript_56246:47-691(-)
MIPTRLSGSLHLQGLDGIAPSNSLKNRGHNALQLVHQTQRNTARKTASGPLRFPQTTLSQPSIRDCTLHRNRQLLHLSLDLDNLLNDGVILIARPIIILHLAKDLLQCVNQVFQRIHQAYQLRRRHITPLQLLFARAVENRFTVGVRLPFRCSELCLEFSDPLHQPINLVSIPPNTTSHLAHCVVRQVFLRRLFEQPRLGNDLLDNVLVFVPSV